MLAFLNSFLYFWILCSFVVKNHLTVIILEGGAWFFWEEEEVEEGLFSFSWLILGQRYNVAMELWLLDEWAFGFVSNEVIILILWMNLVIYFLFFIFRLSNSHELRYGKNWEHFPGEHSLRYVDQWDLFIEEMMASPHLTSYPLQFLHKHLRQVHIWISPTCLSLSPPLSPLISTFYFELSTKGKSTSHPSEVTNKIHQHSTTHLENRKIIIIIII